MFNLRFVKEYLVHRIKANNRHGLHSPFVYRLADNIIYDLGTKKVYPEIEKIRSDLEKDKRTITFTGPAAKSSVNSKRARKISDIAKFSSKKSAVNQLLYRLLADLQPQNVIELGTGLGITTSYLQKAAPNAKVYTLESCPEMARIATESFEKAGVIQIELVEGNFDCTFPKVIREVDKLDFVFVGSNHQKDTALKYFAWCLPKVHDATLLVFEDIYWSEEMKQAWSQIKAHPQVTVTIDLFWIGLVYFKKGQAKEDFMIKI